MVVAPVVVVVMVVVVEYCTPEVPQKVRSSKYDVSKVLYVPTLVLNQSQVGPWGHRASFLLHGVVHWLITFDLFRSRCAGLPEAQNPLQSTSKGPSEVEPSSMPGSQHNIKAQGSRLKQTSRSGYTVPAYMALHAHSVPGKSLQTLGWLHFLFLCAIW